MKTAINVFLALASMGLVGARPVEDKPASQPAAGRESSQRLVWEERAAFEELRRLQPAEILSRAGHITSVAFYGRLNHYSEDLDLNFLSALDQLQRLELLDVPLTTHGLDALPKMKRLTELTLGGAGIFPRIRQVVACPYARSPVSESLNNDGDGLVVFL